MPSFHKQRSEVNYEQVPNSLVKEMYLHLISSSIQDHILGKLALKKKGSKCFEIATLV